MKDELIRKRKRNTIAAILTIPLFFLIVIALLWMLKSMSGQQDENPSEAELSSRSEETLQTDEEEPESGSVSAAEARPESENAEKVIWIGDSRTVGVSLAEPDSPVIWSAKSGEGLIWMMEEGVPAIQDQVDDRTHIVIWMGANDCWDGRLEEMTQRYISYINEQTEVWSALGAKVYYASITQVNGGITSIYGNLTNDVIMAWNAKLKEGLDDRIVWIELYDQFDGRILFADQLHYEHQTSREIYDAVMAAAGF